jgi:hypothetical protein
MTLLQDTHAFRFAIGEPERLTVRSAIAAKCPVSITW